MLMNSHVNQNYMTFFVCVFFVSISLTGRLSSLFKKLSQSFLSLSEIFYSIMLEYLLIASLDY